MKRSIVLTGLLMGFACSLHGQAPAQPVDTTVCEVMNKPAAFDGKIVRIKATAMAGFDQFAIKDAADPNCGYPVNVIWLDYPAGTKGKAGPAALVTVQPARNFTGKYTPPTRTPVTLDKNSDFKQFDSALARKHEKGLDMCLGCTQNEVTAVFVGRLDGVAEAGLTYDASGKIVGFGGFGNMNAYPARLVLQSVSNVTPKEIDFSKNDEETKGTPMEDPSVAQLDVYGAITAAQKAAEALPPGPTKDAALKASTIFGKMGEHPGIYEFYGVANEAQPKDEQLGAKDSADGVLFNCTFSSDRLQGYALTRAVIHVGEHIAELRQPTSPNEAMPAFVLESDAWVVTAVTAVTGGQKYLTLPGGYLVWNTKWSGDERNDKMTQMLKDYLTNGAMLSR